MLRAAGQCTPSLLFALGKTGFRSYPRGCALPPGGEALREAFFSAKVAYALMEIRNLTSSFKRASGRMSVDYRSLQA